MNEHEPLLKIRFDGEAVGPGIIPVSHLLRFLINMNKALQRTGRVLAGEATPGYQTPSSVFGADFITGFEGCTRQDLNG